MDKTALLKKVRALAEHGVGGEAEMCIRDSRSPYASYSDSFVIVNTDGTVNNSYANYSLGCAPGFCV